jgi:ubiquinone/menaquinone biosynthesis C-methylase UbiE
MELNSLLGMTSRIGEYDRYEYLLSNIPNGHGKCLDVGGAYVETVRDNIHNKGYKYYNIDLRKCKDSITTDATNIPFKNETFNAVILSFTILYIGEWWNAIKEISRILKKDGSVYFSDTVDKFEGEFEAIPEEKQHGLIKFPHNDIHGEMWKLSIKEIIPEFNKNKLILSRMDIRFNWQDCFLHFQKV